ncbi:MAG: ATP-dependent helicase PcrA [Phycisphaerales bacterium]|nr:ATP-dependent helicase PcrA [Phycisphaerales bacterium]
MLETEQLLKDLTPPQREAVTHVDGPLLIVAGAGSGKTRVITRRVAYLIRQGIPAPTILAITFTNKAAGEMKSRISNVVGRQMRDFGRLDQPWPTICTFHSLCLRALRHFAPQIGLPTNFTIYDSSDQNKVVKEALKMLDVSSTNFSPSTVHATISNAKNQLIGPDAFAQTAGDFYQRTVARVFKKYQELLKQNNALDFDDLLLRTVSAFRDHPEVLAGMQDRFQYLLIDEYQDTNHAQYVMAHAIALRHRNLCVVGDPDQSIYAWRGADIQNILDFEKDYPDAKVVRLEQNYRSSQRILRIASQLIANNTQRKDKSLWTENAQGDAARLFLCQDEHDEAAIITQQLREAHEQAGFDWNKMAIFYRMNSLSRVMEDALRKAGVPYQIARGVEFYNRKEIKDVLAYLRVVANPSDEVSLSRIVNVPARGLGDAAIKVMSAYAVGNGISLWQAMERAASIAGLSPRAANAAKQFVQLVERWRSLAYGAGSRHPAGASATSTEFADAGQLVLIARDLIAEGGSPGAPAPSGTITDHVVHGRVRDITEAVIRQSGLEEYLKKTGGDEQDEMNNVAELVNSASEFDRDNPEGTLDDFLAQISLVSDADHMKGAGGAVTLMTLHAAKGLEFPVVAMIGLEEGILPHSRARGNLTELEEERRLCFVGITRAQDRLLLSKAARRMIRGISERTIPSPFLHEMPQEEFEVVDRTGFASMRSQEGYRRGAGDDYYDADARRESEPKRQFSHYRQGQVVRHPTFGIGRIREVSEMGDNRTRAVVQFNEAGQKTLILEFARLELIG